MVEIPEKLAIAVTFFYREDRLRFLKEASRDFSSLAREVGIWIVTNSPEREVAEKIRAIIPDANVVSPVLLGHPYLLPWSHLALFRDLIRNKMGFSHFLYTEDDLYVKKENVVYWLEAEELLTPFGLIPGFVRFEYRPDGQRVATDITQTHNYNDMPRVEARSYSYVGFNKPYQGMYLMNRPMMEEFFSSESSSPTHPVKWGIREKATQGLVWEKVPPGAYSRSFVGFRRFYGLDERALVHHLPNNYAKQAAQYPSTSPHGVVPIEDLVDETENPGGWTGWSKFWHGTQPQRRARKTQKRPVYYRST